MPTAAGAVRRYLLTPALSRTTFSTRGFPAPPCPATRGLEAIPQAVICGFEWAVDTRDLWEIERRLDLVEPTLRGFAYEGATMAFTVLDAMTGGTRTRELLRGPGEKHLLVAYIGVGFAMARLPRPLWRKVLPDLDGNPYHPTMSWLAVDGYGFDLAFFDHRRWIEQQRRPRPYPWIGYPAYFSRAVDQGIGRALWFFHGGRPDAVRETVERFAPRRRPDLFSGVGLAATYAGGAEAGELERLRDRVPTHRADLAVGAVFAAKARAVAGLVPDWTESGTAALAGLPVAAATELADRTAVSRESPHAAPSSGGVPPYELWRQRIREHFGAPCSEHVNTE
ncbi:DUF1702 family protein [Saccharomonospora halophila]|uniref:DUF1702 family protein n=1 Tax=Saccharomonospora halophila TaxID=129922 RepID=UPI0003755935|nr:DUF1702 family protein [Saccharomonospora halophila]